MPSASGEVRERLYDDLWELRLMIRGTPERLRGRFIRMHLTDPICILPDGRILMSTVKRREEWPEEAKRRTLREMQDLGSRIWTAEENV